MELFEIELFDHLPMYVRMIDVNWIDSDASRYLKALNCVQTNDE